MGTRKNGRECMGIWTSGCVATYVRKEFGKLRKNCLFVVSSRDTMSVAKRSRVSCGWKAKLGRVRVEDRRRKRPLDTASRALLSSSYGMMRGYLVEQEALWRIEEREDVKENGFRGKILEETERQVQQDGWMRGNWWSFDGASATKKHNSSLCPQFRSNIPPRFASLFQPQSTPTNGNSWKIATQPGLFWRLQTGA